MTTYVINLSVVTDDNDIAIRSWEIVTRTAAGLGLDGIDVSTSLNTITEGTDNEEGDTG